MKFWIRNVVRWVVCSKISGITQALAFLGNLVTLAGVRGFPLRVESFDVYMSIGQHTFHSEAVERICGINEFQRIKRSEIASESLG